MPVPSRPLGLVKEILQEYGMEISYAYDDLVFVEHNHFLLQFGASGEHVLFFANEETDAAEAKQIVMALQQSAEKQGIRIEPSGCYRMQAAENNLLSLEFMPLVPAAT